MKKEEKKSLTEKYNLKGRVRRNGLMGKFLGYKLAPKKLITLCGRK